MLKIVSVIIRTSAGCDRSHVAGRTNKQTRSRSVTLSNQQFLEKTELRKLQIRPFHQESVLKVSYASVHAFIYCKRFKLVTK